MDCINCDSNQFEKERVESENRKLSHHLSTLVSQIEERIKNFQDNIDKFKTQICQDLNNISSKSMSWIALIDEIVSQKTKLNLLKELDINNQSVEEKELGILMELSKCNEEHYSTIDTMFQKVIFGYAMQNCEESFKDIFLIDIYKEFEEKNNIINAQDVNQIAREINYNCLTHNSKITKFNIGQVQEKQKRGLCQYCEQDEIITINCEEFEQQWKIYQQRQKEFARNINSRFSIKLDKVNQHLRDLRNNQFSSLTQLINYIDKQNLFLLNQHEIYQEFSHNTNQLDQVLDMAEKISQQHDHLSKKKLELTNTNINVELAIFVKVQHLIRLIKDAYIIVFDNFTSISSQLINTYDIKWCTVLVFNKDRSIMVAGAYGDLIIFKFTNQGLYKLKEEKDTILSLVFSKKTNWFATGRRMNGVIISYKEQPDKEWQYSTFDAHNGRISQMILNNDEDELITCSNEEAIKIWNVNCEENKLNYKYTLQLHIDNLSDMSLNESNTALVACSNEKEIVIWVKDQSKKWQFITLIYVSYFSGRICFVSETIFLLQEQKIGLVHFYELKNQKVIEKPELQISLCEQENGYTFHPLSTRQKKVVILSHDKTVYILKQDQDSKLLIQSNPIICSDTILNFCLTEDGKYLIIATVQSLELHMITYFGI